MLRILLGLVFAATFIPGSLLADGGGIGISVQIRILTEDDFQEHVAGHRLEDRDGNWSIGYPNYRLTGEYDGLKLTGRWNWRGKLWCRTGSLGGKKVEDCSRLDLKGDRLRVQPSGGGNTVTYRLKF